LQRHDFLLNCSKPGVFLETRKSNYNSKMKIKTLICTSIASGLITVGLIGCMTHKETQAQLESQAKLSRAQAEKIALAKVPGGTIKEGELEKEKGKLIWSFDIATPGTQDIKEVQVDAISGQIVAMETETPAQQKKEKKKDKEDDDEKDEKK
jgi:uncharacterized membrane protein YkoI